MLVGLQVAVDDALFMRGVERAQFEALAERAAARQRSIG
jgi:hypothetical protein